VPKIGVGSEKDNREEVKKKGKENGRLVLGRYLVS
jgi:hypothetical protein